MAWIFNFSFYAIDKYNHHLDIGDLMNALKKNYWFKDCVFHQVHVRESNKFVLDVDDPVLNENCDLKDIEKHFNHDKDMNGAEDIVIGGVYRHFKGKIVKVMTVARDTEFGQLNVIYYEPEVEDGGVWSRPIDMFLSDVDHDKYPDVQQKKRFELIDE